MIAAFDDYWRIARVTTVQRDAGAGRVMKLVAALEALALVVGIAVAVAQHAFKLDVLARGALGLAAFWLAIVWATMFVPGSVLLNSPVNAHLLPRQRRRLVQMTASGWLVCTVAFAGAFGNWATLPLCGLYLIGLPLLLTGHRKAAPLVFLACGWPFLSRSVLPSWLAEQVTTPASVLALSVLLLALGVYYLRQLYPNGGDAHLDKRSDQLKRIQRLTAQGAANMSEAGGPTGKGILRMYGLALRRDCHRADPATMLMHALGPAAHWSAWLGAMIALPSGVIGLRLLRAWHASRGMDQAIDVAANVALGTLSAIVAFSTAQFGQQMRRTRGEQALLRLTPLAGDAGLLNRRLAKQLLMGGLRNWGMMTGCILVATLLISGDGEAVLRQFALCCLAGQVAMLGLLGDYAGGFGWNLMRGLSAGVLALLEAGAAVGLGRLTGASPWPWLILIALAGAAFQLRYSWRLMLAAPSAFPADRLA